MELVRRRLEPAVAADAAHVDRLLRDLDADAYATREAATAELSKLAGRIEPRLRAARAAASAEARRRLDKVLEQAAKPTPEQLRAGRALMVLEWVATTDAARVVEALARGDEGDSLTQAAAEARMRLQRRAGR